MMLRPRALPAPAAPLPRSGLRLRLLILVAAALLMVGWFAGLLRSGRGWLTIGLAVLVAVLLAAHRRDGGRRWLARVVCEYAAVALLAALLVLAVGGAPQQHPAHRRPATAGAAGQLCPRSCARPLAASATGSRRYGATRKPGPSGHRPPPRPGRSADEPRSSSSPLPYPPTPGRNTR